LHALTSPAADLPDGTMILQDEAPHLILGGLARAWSLRGYGPPVTPLNGAQLITPPSTVAVLRAGYRPQIHAGAFAASDGPAVEVCRGDEKPCRSGGNARCDSRRDGVR